MYANHASRRSNIRQVTLTVSHLTFSIRPGMQPYLNKRAPVGLCIVIFNQTVDPSDYLLLGISVRTTVTLSDWDTVKRYLGV